MSELDAQVTEHEVYATIAQLQEVVSSAQDKVGEDLGSLDTLRRIERLVLAVQRNLASADPLLTSVKALSDLNVRCSSIVTELNAFIANGNSGHITNANNHVDPTITALRQVYVVANTSDVEAMRESIVSFRRSVGQLFSNIELKANEITVATEATKAQLTELAASIEVQKTRLDSAITNFQANFSTSESERQKAFNEALVDMKDQLDTLVGKIEEEKSRSQELFKAETNKIIASFTADSQESLDDLHKKQDEAKEIVGIIANTGMAGGFQQIANQSRRSAIIWQAGAVASMLGFLGFAIWAFVLTNTAGAEEGAYAVRAIDWGAVGVRAFVATAFGILAAYCARRGEHHESAELQKRQSQLELTSINPYLEDMPPEERIAVKKDLAKRLFGQDLSPVKKLKSVEGTSGDALLQAVEALADLARDLVKRQQV